MKAEICDIRNGKTCSEVKSTIEITNNGVSLKAPDGSTFINLGINGEIYFAEEKWDSEYKLELRAGHSQTYDMVKKC